MNATKSNSITLMQYIFLIHGAQVATVVFSLPRLVAQDAGTDGWISIILNWAFSVLAGWLFLLTLRKYPELTLPGLAERLFGKWLGKLLLLMAIVYFAFSGWFIIINSMLYIKSWFLSRTPEYVIVLLLAIPGYMVVRQGLRVQGRYAEFVFYMTIWMLLFLLVPLRHGHWIHLLPVFKDSLQPIMNGTMNTLSSFSGIEIVFIIYPFLQKKQYALRGMFIANTLTLFVYLFTTISCFVFFSPDGITSINQPLLFLLKNIEFRFLERLDMVSLALYLFVVSVSWMPFVYCAVFSSSRLLNKADHRNHAFLYFAAVVAGAYFIQPTWDQSEQWLEWYNLIFKIVIGVIPIVLYVYVWGVEKVRKRRAG